MSKPERGGSRGRGGVGESGGMRGRGQAVGVGGRGGTRGGMRGAVGAAAARGTRGAGRGDRGRGRGRGGRGGSVAGPKIEVADSANSSGANLDNTHRPLSPSSIPPPPQTPTLQPYHPPPVVTPDQRPPKRLNQSATPQSLHFAAPTFPVRPTATNSANERNNLEDPVNGMPGQGQLGIACYVAATLTCELRQTPAV